eukprot:TRINITY_DN2579_c0_g1_i8.p1 TRINITY_DN2579_c0_g1~~TRINITY_DN2579_c0_g1_i8.p1  ORF type:complete len:485 (+),score=73.81 TRINITY_DN2579_c0_g1_i8:162-1616(+)
MRLQFFYQYYFGALKNVPGPPRGSFLLGHLPQFLAGETGAVSLKFAEQYGDIYKSTFGFTSRVTINHPDDVRKVLVTNSSNFLKNDIAYDMIRGVLGESILTMTDPQEHHSVRKLINPAFKSDTLKSLAEVFDRDANILIKKWHHTALTGGVLEDVHGDLTRMTVDVIGHTGFDVDFGAQSGTQSYTLFDAFSALMKTFEASALQLLPFVRYLPTARTRQRARTLKLIHAAVAEVLQKKRASARKQEGEDVSIIDILIDAVDDHGRGLSDEQLRGQVVTFLLAGHETTSTALTWTLILLSQHANELARAQEELDSVFGPYNGEDIHVSADAMHKLPTITNIIKESMRIYPPVAFTIRKAQRDSELAGHMIPGGMRIAVNIYTMHHAKTLWYEPEQFLPDRWLSDTEKGFDNPRHPMQWLPFIAGPRNCIGMKFAMLEMTVALSKILHRFHFAPVPGLKISRKNFITMRPFPIVKLNIVERQHAS